MIKELLAVFALICLFVPASSATISGTVYSAETFEELPNAIVSINTTPEQQVLAKDSNYSFEVPLGKFEIKAKFFDNGVLTLETLEDLLVENEGSYKIDLIMLPADYDQNLEQELLGGQLDDFEISQKELPQQVDNSWILLAGILVFLIGLMVWLALKKKPETQENIEKPKAEKPRVLDKNAQEVLQALREKGNRATQKELLGKVHFGEAYLSLVLTELESEGKVKKIKKGRGNIIILKE